MRKTLSLCRALALASLLFGLTFTGHGQSLLPLSPKLVDPDFANPDQMLADGLPGIENTGADYQDDVDGGRLRVMCWDGEKPGFGWVFSDSPTNPSSTDVVFLDGAPDGHMLIDGPQVVSAGREIRDPDIVTWYNPVIRRWYIVLTFEQDLDGYPQVLYSIYQFNPKPVPGHGPLTLVSDPANPDFHYPQLVSYRLNNREPADFQYPNVDIGQGGYVAFTYSNGEHIFGRIRDLSGIGNAYPLPSGPFVLNKVSAPDQAVCFPDDSRFRNYHPDVSVYQEASATQPSDVLIRFCWVQRTFSILTSDDVFRVVMTAHLASDLQAYVVPNCSQDVSYIVPLNFLPSGNAGHEDQGWHVNRPRITSVYTPTSNKNDFLVIVPEELGALGFPVGGAGAKIRLFARQSSVSSTVTDRYLNHGTTIDKISQCGNFRPVVTASADPFLRAAFNSAVADWEYNAWVYGNYYGCLTNGDGSSPPILANQEIIARNTALNGAPMHPGEFYQVADDIPGYHRVPSVAGGRSTSQVIKNVLHVWVDDRESSIWYQEAEATPAGSNGLRSAQQLGPWLHVVPNPANSESLLMPDLQAGERIMELSLVEMYSGRVVAYRALQEEITNAGLPLSMLIDPHGVKSGLYCVKVITNQRAGVVKLDYQGAD